MFNFLNTSKASKKIAECKRMRLESLDLSSCKLKVIPDEVFELEHIVNLDLSGNFSFKDNNNIKYISKKIKFLINLESINFNFNPLVEIPHELAQCTKIKSLNFLNAHFLNLPEEFGDLKNLERLSVVGSYIHQLPNSFENLDKLVYLGFVKCGFSKFPEVLFKLKNLEELWFPGHEIGYIDNRISEMQSLKRVNFSLCNLTTFPKGFLSLKNLENVSLINNNISELPLDLYQMNKLKELHLENNSIARLPIITDNLETLEVLDVKKNPLELPPIEIAELGIGSIRTYFKSKKINATRIKIEKGETDKLKEHILNSLKDDRLKEALDKLEEISANDENFLGSVILLKAKYVEYKRNSNTGTIDQISLMQIKMQIMSGVIELLKEK